MLIYHIVLPEIWESFREKTFYEAASLQTENFIHCSYPNQLEAVLERYYKDEKRVLILSLDPDLLTSELVAEPSTGGEIYPHVYGQINKTAIVEITEKVLG